VSKRLIALVVEGIYLLSHAVCWPLLQPILNLSAANRVSGHHLTTITILEHPFHYIATLRFIHQSFICDKVPTCTTFVPLQPRNLSFACLVRPDPRVLHLQPHPLSLHQHSSLNYTTGFVASKNQDWRGLAVCWEQAVAAEAKLSLTLGRHG